MIFKQIIKKTPRKRFSNANKALHSGANEVIGFFVFSFFCLGISFLLFSTGCKTIKDKVFHHAWENKSSFAIGPLIVASKTEKGEEILEGDDAVQIGVGCVALGLFFAESGCVLIYILIRRLFKIQFRTYIFHQSLTLFSLVFFSAGVLNLLPPSRIEIKSFALAFYLSVIVTISFIVFHTFSNSKILWKYYFPIFFVSLFLFGYLLPDIMGGLLVGFFAASVFCGHIYLFTNMKSFEQEMFFKK